MDVSWTTGESSPWILVTMARHPIAEDDFPDLLARAADGDREAAEAGDKDAAITLGREATKKLDKAASKGVIHKNQAANRKSAIAKKAASL